MKKRQYKLGACFLIPIAMTFIAEAIPNPVMQLYHDMAWSKQIALSFLLVAAAFFAFGTELRFSLFRYVIAAIVWGLMMSMYALKSFKGVPTLIPVGGGLVGLLFTWGLGNLGVSTYNWIIKTGGRYATRIAASVGITINALAMLIIVSSIGLHDSKRNRSNKAMESETIVSEPENIEYYTPERSSTSEAQEPLEVETVPEVPR